MSSSPQQADEDGPSPEISVLMVAYNAEQYLGEALESIAEQRTGRSWELLFVDDGSTDKTYEVAKTFQRRTQVPMRLLQHQGSLNRGISASRNLALRHARGSLLAFIDADDVWLSNHLETQALLLEANPGVAMVYAGAERWVHFDRPFDEQRARAAAWGDNYLPPLVPLGAASGVLSRGILLDWFLKDESLVPCICTVMVRTAAARAIGGFCDEFRGSYDDQVFHAKMSARFRVYANDICVARYRQHSDSCCALARGAADIQQAEQKRFHMFLSSDTFQNQSANEKPQE